MNNPNPEMLVMARESRGVSQSDLARDLDVTQSAVSKMENGTFAITEQMIERIAKLLHYPESLFYVQDMRLGLGPSEIFHYRKRAKLTKKSLDMFHAQVSLRRIHVRMLLNSVDIEPFFEIPHLDIDEFGTASRVAQAVRATWHVPRGPIKNLTKLIEDAGAIVMHHNFGTDMIDAISRDVPGTPPLFFINPQFGGARYRYTLAHELGHIVMHSTPRADMEAEANEFAAEFLMPGDEIGPMLTNLTEAKIANLTPYWRTSMSAILQRAAQLGRLTQRQEKALRMRFAAAGYMKKEPPELDIPIEQPTILTTVVQSHLQDLGYQPHELAAAIHLLPDELAARLPLGQRALRAV